MSIDKSGYKAGGTYSPLSKYYETETDPYSPVIVEDLLQVISDKLQSAISIELFFLKSENKLVILRCNSFLNPFQNALFCVFIGILEYDGVNEWRNIQDIIRLTFKALTDVVKAQGETLRELERQMPSRASKSELNSGLALKANISDVSKTIAEVVTALETKVSIDDTQILLKDYVSRSDFQYIMSNKANIDEVKQLVESRVTTQEFRGEAVSLSNRIDEYYKEMSKKVGSMVTQRDFLGVQAALDSKANATEMKEELENKANKQSVSNALHRKANRADIEALLSRKADINDVQNILNAIDQKVDNSTLDKVTEVIDNKVDRSDFDYIAGSLNNKADRTEIEHITNSYQKQRNEGEHSVITLEKKMDHIKSELENQRQSMNTLLDKKADVRDIERVIQLASKKTDIDLINSSLIETKTEVSEELGHMKTDFGRFKRTIEELVNEKTQRTENFGDKLAEDVFKLNEQLRNILEERRNDIEETAKFVKNVSNTTKKELQLQNDKILDEVEELKKTIEDIITRKLEKKEFIELKSKIQTQLEDKVDLVEVQNALNTSQADVSSRFVDFREEVKNLIRNQENDLYNQMNKKANLVDVNSAISAKADSSSIHSLLSQKAGVTEFEDIKRKLELIVREIDEKCGLKDLEQFSLQHKKSLDDIQRDVLLKANIKDVVTILDTKSNIDEVNKALVDIHKDLDSKASQDELATIINDQAAINESLCTENILGRWAWKSGDVRNGNSVPWEIQLTNTLPDNFLWEKEKTSILTVASGLYEINASFFSRKRPAIQILVNGEPIFNAEQYQYYVIQPSKKEVDFSSTNITGVSITDYIMLPDKARISVIYDGESIGEGFIGLKRL